MHFSNGVIIPSEPAIDLVRILSEGTYTSFPQALKEFISNSFDADAKKVEVMIDDDSNGITIRDNGEGMTLTDFGDAFAGIARSGKPRKGLKRGRTKSGRVKIGKFGLGTLAVVAICDSFSVRSTREGSSEGFVARLDIAALRKHFDKRENLSDCWKFEAEKWFTEAKDTHFTEIRLEGLSSDIRSGLERPGEQKIDEEFESVTQLSGIDQLSWQLGLTCPVAYEHDYPINKNDLNKRTDAVLIEHARRLIRDRFALILNGREVKRRIVLPKYRGKKREDIQEKQRLMKRTLGYDLKCFRSPPRGVVRFEGYVLVQAQQLFPAEIRGLLVRMRGVGIGGYKTFNLTGSSIATMLPSLSGEIWVESGLDDALQFDRESFREDHPNFIWFRQQIASQVEKEQKGFRDRSAKRTTLKKREKPLGKASKEAKPKETEISDSSNTTPLADTFIDVEIFRGSPPYISFLVPQINGCWDRGWYEACALVSRRLLETLIVHLYEKRGWAGDIRTAHGYLKLQNLVDKACGDGRVGLGQKAKDGLQHLKEIGDVAAHDYRVKVRKSDLERKRNDFRLACERLLFIAGS